MDKKLKEIRTRIQLYFGKEVNRVRAFRYHSDLCIDVEYEDFRPVNRVENDIRSMIGSDYLLNVKREFSSNLLIDMALKIVSYEQRQNYEPVRY